MQKQEITKIENFMQKKFNLGAINIKQRPQKDDSAEVYIGDEFIGVIYRDEDDDLSYSFQMAILEFDLE